MKNKDRRRHAKSKRKLSRRLKNEPRRQGEPVMGASNIHYEIGEKAQAIDCGGIGAIHMLAIRSGLVREIDESLKLLKIHMPYHESDHVLNMVYNIIAGGQCIEDIELLRQNPAYMDAVGAKRIPDPTTECDFLRRFNAQSVEDLFDAAGRRRQAIWRLQSKAFRREAIIQVDGTIQETTGECKEGMDMSYNGKWSYAPLIVSLASTREPLYLENRPGNTPSSKNAVYWLDKSIDICSPVFEKVTLRGDTDYALTGEFDRWTEAGVGFAFGYDANRKVVGIAEKIADWAPLARPERYEVKTEPRTRPENVKERIVRERGYKTLVLDSEEIAEFAYRPVKCAQDYRMVVVRKTIHVLQGQLRLQDEVRYFFYITNDWRKTAEELVFFCNDRCDHENDIEQLRNGVHAFKMPTGDLVSNWAYMAIISLAWTLKSWMGLLMPHRATGREVVRMEFRRFLATFINVPAQIIQNGRRIVYRLLGYMPRAPVFFGFMERCRALRL